MIVGQWSSVRRRSGYTLPELMTLIVVLGIVANLIALGYHALGVRSREGRRKVLMGEMAAAIGVYYADRQTYPQSSLTTPYSSEPGDVFPNGSGRDGNWIPGLAPKYLPVLPRDPEGGLGPNSLCNAVIPRYKQAFSYISDGKSWKLMSRCSRPANEYDAADPSFDWVRPYWATMVCGGEPAACQSW